MKNVKTPADEKQTEHTLAPFVDSDGLKVCAPISTIVTLYDAKHWLRTLLRLPAEKWLAASKDTEDWFEELTGIHSDNGHWLAAYLQLPTEPGDGEWIADPFTTIPKLARHCIKLNLVWGQKLRKGETLQSRIDAIRCNPGEIQKWMRLLAVLCNEYQDVYTYGIQPWHEGESEAMAFVVACHYWSDFFTSCTDVIWELLNSKEKGQIETHTRILQNFVEEGKAYWGWNSPCDVVLDYGYELEDGEVKRCVGELLDCTGQILRTGDDSKRFEIIEELWGLGKAFHDFGSFAHEVHEQLITEKIERKNAQTMLELMEARTKALLSVAGIQALRFKAEMHKARKEAEEEAEARQQEAAETQRLKIEVQVLETKCAELQKNSKDGRLPKEAQATLEEINRKISELTKRSEKHHAEQMNATREEGVRTREAVEIGVTKLEDRQLEAGEQMLGAVKEEGKKAAGRKRKRDSDERLVRGFLYMRKVQEEDKQDAECKHTKPTPKGRIAEHVIAKIGLSIQTSRFLRLYDGKYEHTPNWFKLGCPDTGAKYADAKALDKEKRENARKG